MHCIPRKWIKTIKYPYNIFSSCICARCAYVIITYFFNADFSPLIFDVKRFKWHSVYNLTIIIRFRGADSNRLVNEFPYYMHVYVVLQSLFKIFFCSPSFYYLLAIKQLLWKYWSNFVKYASTNTSTRLASSMHMWHENMCVPFNKFTITTVFVIFNVLQIIYIYRMKFKNIQQEFQCFLNWVWVVTSREV